MDYDYLNQPLVFYHANCYDGFGAVYALSCINPNAVVAHNTYPVKHNAELDCVMSGFCSCVANEFDPLSIIFVDYCPTPDTVKALLETWSAQCRHPDTLRVLVIDHHIGSVKHLEALQSINSIPDSHWKVKIDVVYSSMHSAAVLAWTTFSRDAVPLLLSYIEDRDMWWHNRPDSKEVNAFIRSHDLTIKAFNTVEAAFANNFRSIVESGKTILRTHKTAVAKIAENAKAMTFAGSIHVRVLTTPYDLASDIADYLLDDNPESPVIVLTAFPDIKVSIRSREGCKMTAREIAERLGGSGHTHAAGASCTHDHLMSLLQ